MISMIMSTTIQVSDEMKIQLSGLKLHPRETYNEVLERILEDMKELNEKTKRELEKAIKEIEDGECLTHDEVGKELGFR
jgi:predicted transcriptional regulator